MTDKFIDEFLDMIPAKDKYNSKSISECTKKELDDYYDSQKRKIPKVDKPKYERLECFSCSECKDIREMRNKECFSFYKNTDRYYLVTCTDNQIRHCEVGEKRPTWCYKWEKSHDKFMEGLKRK